MDAIDSFLKTWEKVTLKATKLRMKFINYKYTPLEEPMNHILTEMNRNKVDFAMVFPAEYLIWLMHNRSNAVPLAGFTMFGKPYYSVCFYVRKDSAFKTILDLRGKRWGGTRTREMRFSMYESGIDEPVAKFFSEMKYIENTQGPPLFDALLTGKIDTFAMPDFQFKMLTNANKKYRAIAPLNCREYEYNWMIVYRKGIPEEDVMKFKELLLTSHVNKDAAPLKFLFTVTKGRFISLDLKDLKNTKRIAELTDKKGWLKEEQDFIKANYKEQK